jgi:hypothetical protein
MRFNLISVKKFKKVNLKRTPKFKLTKYLYKVI